KSKRRATQESGAGLGRGGVGLFPLAGGQQAVPLHLPVEVGALHLQGLRGPAHVAAAVLVLLPDVTALEILARRRQGGEIGGRRRRQAVAGAGRDAQERRREVTRF